MKITIITVCLNSGDTIEDTIMSVLQQDYDDIEYIIIDGGSTDNTMSIIRKYQDKINHVISEPDEGMYHALNKGINMANGDITGLLNADDFYKDDRVISDVVRTFEENNVDAVYADLVYVNRKNTKKILRYWKAGKFKMENFLKGWMPPHPAFFVKRSVYEEYGTFNTGFSFSADYELMLRLLYRYQIKAAYLPRTIIKMRYGGRSNASVKNRIKANMEDRIAWEINGLEPSFSTFIKKPLSKVMQFFTKVHDV